MRKLKEVLRLHSLGMSQHQIARSCSISQSTVHEYVSAAESAGVPSGRLPENWDDRGLSKRCFRTGRAGVWRKHPEPDWAKIHQDLQTHKNLTLQLVWQEERESNPEGYGYSRFCDLYRRWLKKLDLVLRQEHRAGEKLFVDYAGDTIPIHDPRTGDPSGRPYSWRCWAPAAIPSPRPLQGRTCVTGSARTSGLSSSWAA
jgi:hypothetical protein